MADTNNGKCRGEVKVEIWPFDKNGKVAKNKSLKMKRLILILSWTTKQVAIGVKIR